MILTCLCLKMRYSSLFFVYLSLVTLRRIITQVEIVLESIIGRTVEQSMTEVQHEEEVLRARSMLQ